eukprot:1890202-Amphidinium_carterae.1
MCEAPCLFGGASPPWSPLGVAGMPGTGEQSPMRGVGVDIGRASAAFTLGVVAPPILPMVGGGP